MATNENRKTSVVGEQTNEKRKLPRQKPHLDAELGDLTNEKLFSHGGDGGGGNGAPITPDGDVVLIAHVDVSPHPAGRSATSAATTTTVSPIPAPTSSLSEDAAVMRGGVLRDSKGRRISRDRLDAQWAKNGAVNRADIRTEDDPGTLAGESSTSDEDDAPGGSSSGASSHRFKKFSSIFKVAGLNMFGRKKKKKLTKEKKERDAVLRLQSCGPVIDVTPMPEGPRAPLAQPEETDTPEHRASGNRQSGADLPTSMSDSQMMVVEFGANFAIDVEGATAALGGGESAGLPADSASHPSTAGRPHDLETSYAAVEVMDQNENSLPYDQISEEERQARIAKVVEKLESLAARISSAQTPAGEGEASIGDADVQSSSSAFSSYNPLSLFNSIRGMLPLSTGSASSTTASHLAHLAELPPDPNSVLPDPGGAGSVDPPVVNPASVTFHLDERKEEEEEKEEQQEWSETSPSPESGVDVVSPSDGGASSFPETSGSSPPQPTPTAPSSVRRPSVPTTLNLDLNVPADRERLYQPILRELLRPASEFTHFSRIASTLLRPHNHAGQLAKFFEITSNAILMTGSPQDQERLKEWAMRYFEENLAPFLVEEGWDGVLDGVEDEVAGGGGGGGGGGETETSRDSELD